MRRTLLAAAVLLAAATACGNQPSGTGVASVANAGGSPSASPSASTSVDPEEQSRKYAKCMRDHGVDMPDPDPNQPNKIVMGKAQGDKDKFKKAMDACKSLSPFKDRSQLSPEDQEKMRDFAKCMRENGVDMPDPNANGDMVAKRTKDTRLDPNDPAFKKAMDACRSQMPQMGVKR